MVEYLKEIGVETGGEVNPKEKLDMIFQGVFEDEAERVIDERNMMKAR